MAKNDALAAQDVAAGSTVDTTAAAQEHALSILGVEAASWVDTPQFKHEVHLVSLGITTDAVVTSPETAESSTGVDALIASGIHSQSVVSSPTLSAGAGARAAVDLGAVLGRPTHQGYAVACTARGVYARLEGGGGQRRALSGYNDIFRVATTWITSDEWIYELWMYLFTDICTPVEATLVTSAGVSDPDDPYGGVVCYCWPVPGSVNMVRNSGMEFVVSVELIAVHKVAQGGGE